MDISDLRLQLIDGGWNPVPASPADKGCWVVGWPTIETNEFHVDNWTKTHPAHTNTGLVCNKDYFAVDIDILSDPMLAHRVQAVAFQHLGLTPFIRVGRAPRCLLVYRQRPGAIRSDSFKAAADTGDGIDILASSRQFVAFGIHPTTRRPYRWVGEACPLEDTPADAPLVLQGQVDTFLAAVNEIMPFGHGTADAMRHRSSAGLIDDGRENFLRDCIWKAAHQIDAAGAALTADAVAAVGWEMFAQGAWNGDGKYSHKNAFAKARALIRRINSGRVSLDTKTVPPTPSDTVKATADDARRRFEEAFSRFLQMVGEEEEEEEQEQEQEQPIIHAARGSTGVGKTRKVARLLAQHCLHRPGRKPWFYAVPTHRVGDDIAQQFVEHGITAKVFRGRKAKVPDDPQKTMCLNLEQVAIAEKAGQPVTSSCCRHKSKGRPEQLCKFYHDCAYQRQLRGEKPDVWIGAHELLFHPQRAFGKIAGVVIDEDFWQDGIRISDGISLDEIAGALIPSWRKQVMGAELDELRNVLAKALRQQPNVGGVARQYIQHLTSETCKHAIKLEFLVIDKLRIWPGMPVKELKVAAKAIPVIRRARRIVGIWAALREMLYRPEIEVSGRLVIDEDDEGRRVVKVHGIAPICEQWKVPTFVMSATLPALPILQAFYPRVEVVLDIEAAMPHVFVQQVLKAPASASRLLKTSTDVNRQAVRRYILQRWLQVGRQPTLVITQQKYEEWLRGKLPDNIAVEHFNDIAGLDHYREVRLLILIGRTIPGPGVVETMAGALSGIQPVKAAVGAGGLVWYNKVQRGIRLPDGTGAAVDCDEHPDSTAEAVRWQICEGELLQALGRGRGVNRTANTVLNIDILADVCLPIVVNEVTRWQPPSEIIEMAADGMVLVSPVDMVRVWPHVWANTRSADRTLAALRGQTVQDFLRGLCRCVPGPEGGSRPITATKSFIDILAGC